MNVDQLNFHHLRYFWAVAKDGNLTRTARRLRVSQSALSLQIRALEDQLGEPLFTRVGRRLERTEAGDIALAYAEAIFGSAGELLSTLSERRRTDALRIGAVATLSRNFQASFVRPLLRTPGVTLRLEAGRLGDLLERLAGHTLDVVLSNQPPTGGAAFVVRRVARQGVSLVGRPRAGDFRFPQDLAGARMILPGPDTELRAAFDALCARLGVAVSVLAEVDDMATMRLLARDTDALALLPSVVVRDELRSGTLHELWVAPDLFEGFYAVTVTRRFPHPLLDVVLRREESDILDMR